MSSSRRWLWIAPILLYAASALEMFIMISPAAAYFYSVYTPLFHGLEQSAVTAWLPQFFLPHLAHTQIPLFRGFGILGALLALVGLIGFLVCAVQLYYGKFVKKRLVSGGLYGRVRHPQYLCLVIAGAGLLLLWPRFFILVTYLMMLGLYYILARHEEETLIARYGETTEDYLARVPMLNPFRGHRQAGTWAPPSRRKALTAWFSIVVVSIVLAFLLRAVVVTQLYAVQWQSPNVTAVAFRALADGGINATMKSVLATDSLQAIAQQNSADALFLQIVSGRSQLRHLLIDLGMTPEALAAVEAPKQGEFVVVSRVFQRDPGGQSPPDPFMLGARITPLFLAQPPDRSDQRVVETFLPQQFYQDFARVLF